MGGRDPGVVEAAAVFADADEETLHRIAMKTLADKLDRPLDEVRPVYERHYIRLKADARVGRYLALLTTRRARDELQRRARRADPS